jgi:hypothetical protein
MKGKGLGMPSVLGNYQLSTPYEFSILGSERQSYWARIATIRISSDWPMFGWEWARYSALGPTCFPPSMGWEGLPGMP